MADVRLIDAKPFIDGWKMAVEENLNEARVLMSSGNETLYNRGVLKENIAGLILGFSNDLMKAPTIDTEALRPRGHWIRRKDRYDEAWDCSICGKTVGPVIVLCSKYCLNCGAKME